jgi:hypothetical protein
LSGDPCAAGGSRGDEPATGEHGASGHFKS